MTRLRLVVFDVDGTLVDSQAHILAAMDGAFTSVGRPAPARETTLGIVGLSLPEAMRRLCADASAVECEALVEAYKASFRTLRLTGSIESPLFPGTRTALDALRADDMSVLGVATGKSRRGLDHLLDLHGLTSHFRTTQVADDHPSKPHPSMLLAALRETGVEAPDAVMVGDTEYDIEMGFAAGFRTVGVTWGYHGRARLAGADAVIDSWSELDAVLDGMRMAA